MVLRSDVDRLAALNRRISALVIADLNRFWGELDLAQPEISRDRLLAYLPTLVDRYGDMASTVSADWYSQVRAEARAPGRFTPVIAANSDPVKVETATRRLAADLFTPTPETMLESLQGLVSKYALQSGRNTIDQSATRDPWKPRVARVPTGATTCSFCLMLASRGPIYGSKEKAGATTKFHPHDDCQIVVVGPNQDLPEGYDPAALYEQYLVDKNSPTA